MQIELPLEVENFIRQAVAQGEFASPEDALTSIVHFYRAHEPNVALLQSQLQAGLDDESAGHYGPLDFDDVIRRGHERLAARQ